MKQERIEEIVQGELGKEEFRKLIDYAFDYACEEADYLGIEKKGEPFNRMCVLRRNVLMRDLYDVLETWKDVYGDVEIAIPIPTRDQLKVVVTAHYMNNEEPNYFLDAMLKCAENKIIEDREERTGGENDTR